MVTGEPVVCGITSDVTEPFLDLLVQTDLDYVPGTGHTSPNSTFRLGLLADSSIAFRIEGSALDISDSAEHDIHAHFAPRARRHALDESTEETVKSLLGVPTGSNISTAPAQPIIPPIPHGPAHQPPTSKLLKTLPSSIRSRASSVDKPRPLPFRYKLPPGCRYRIGDHAAFAALKEKNIEWYVTTGLLVEDCTGLRWNAGKYNYLLYWHVEGMPTPDAENTTQKWLKIEPDVVRDWQKENWEAEFGQAVMDVEDEPATPIVEERDAMDEPMPPLGKISSLPLKSALRSQSRPASPCPSMTSDPGSGSPKREKKVRLHSKKQKRFVEWDIETSVDEVDVLSDNEGRTTRKWLGAN
jgi:hypothetical protein